MPLIDLNAMSKPFYEALGPVDAHKAFAGKDTTHHSNYGSYELAKCIVHRDKKGNSNREVSHGYAAFDPAHPDPIAAFAIPAEPHKEPAAAARPYGQ